MASGPTEAEVRRERIDHQLAKAGWRVEGTDFEEEYEVGAVGEPDHGFSDYMLPGPDGVPLAIVEAKRSSRDAIAGKEQASKYAEAIEAVNGRSPVVFLANGDEVWFWDLVSNPRLVAGFFMGEELERRRFQTQQRQPLIEVPIDGSIVDRPYQHEAIRSMHVALEAGKRRAVWVMATGTGKTRTATALIETLLRARWIQRVLFLVDRNALAQQALDAFSEFLPDEPAERIRTGGYDGTKRLHVATLQTMQDFHESFSPGAFDLVISDECHRSIYDKWQNVLSYFDGYLLGLTATPADYIDRNTFFFFGCDDRVPTFGYGLDEAVEEKYLVPYEGYHARTTIQIEGIRGTELPEDVQADLREGGIDPEDLDFAGTELERRVTNTETTRLLVREFFDEAIKEPDGNLPGKSIIFAMSHAHAKRIWQTLADEYPQHPGLTEIIDSHMERPDEILSRFKNESLPRIAISVDMLDTGVDVPTVVNLGFMKPVFSRIKFWQMIGRGTRTVGADAAREWCPADSKDRFRVLDFWENFERFQLNPEGITPRSSTPVAVRYFRSILKLAQLAQEHGLEDLHRKMVAEARSMIEELPRESAGVREYRSLVSEVADEVFWATVDSRKFQLASLEVAPLMRYLPDINPANVSFKAQCLDVAAAMLEGEEDRANRGVASLRESVIRLPAEHPDVAPYRDTVADALREDWPSDQSLDAIMTIRDHLGDLIRLRQPEPSRVITLNLEDAFQERRWVEVGPEPKEFDAEEYRAKVEELVRGLAEEHPALQKVRAGQQLADDDLAAIEALLNQPELYITEDSLRAAYAAPQGSLVALLRHALGVEELQPREDAIKEAFEAFVSERNYLDREKLTFVRLFAQRLIQAGRVHPSDLYEEPFIRLARDPQGQLPADDLDALFELAARYEG